MDSAVAVTSSVESGQGEKLAKALKEMKVDEDKEVSLAEMVKGAIGQSKDITGEGEEPLNTKHVDNDTLSPVDSGATSSTSIEVVEKDSFESLSMAKDEDGQKEGVLRESKSASTDNTLAESPSYKADQDWSITFEQLLASFHTEPPLVRFFENEIDITDAIDKFRNRHVLQRQGSMSVSLNSPPKSL